MGTLLSSNDLNLIFECSTTEAHSKKGDRPQDKKSQKEVWRCSCWDLVQLFLLLGYIGRLPEDWGTN